MSWQPIETAPKDGTHVLVRGTQKTWTCTRIACRHERPSWSGPGVHVSWLTVPGDWQFTPTHWMPLPPPPEQS